MKKVFVFSCAGNQEKQGYTLQRDGENLPKGVDCGQWDFNKEIEASAHMDMIGVNPRHMFDGIDKNGYYIKYPIGKF